MVEIGDTDHTDMERGLLAAARVRLKATELCPDVGETCVSYHSIRPYLRLFGMVGGPGRNAGFFLKALAASEGDKSEPKRILVSGSADDSMYAPARQAVPGAAITMLDRCELPLYLCRHTAGQNSETVATIRGDIFDYTPTGDFHVICSDAFIAQFPAARHGELIDIWRQSLCPGGAVVTTTRIASNTPDEGLARSPAQIAAFRDRVLEKAKPWRHMLDISLDALADWPNSTPV